MKIDNQTRGIPSVRDVGSARASRSPDRPRAAGDSVALSGDARFLRDLRDAMEGNPEIRPDVVETARADLAAGRLGTAEDYDRAISALLTEL